MATTLYENIIEAARKLPIEEQAQLIADLSASLSRKLEAKQTTQAPHENLYGSLAHRGPAPSAEDFDEIRHEMWASVGQDEA